MSRALLVVVLGLVGCSEIGIGRGNLPDPADPPERELDLWGTPPSDWNGCYTGLRGIYYNLGEDHPDVEIEPTDPPDTDPPLDVTELDWWTPPASFQRYDATTDFGGNWWPVDEGFGDDPQYFSGRWIGWLRVTRRGNHDFVLGAATDGFIMLNDEVVAEIRDSDEFDSDVVTLNLQTGVYRLDLRYAHRQGETNGFRFRVASPDILQCYPEYGDEAE